MKQLLLALSAAGLAAALVAPQAAVREQDQTILSGPSLETTGHAPAPWDVLYRDGFLRALEGCERHEKLGPYEDDGDDRKHHNHDGDHDHHGHHGHHGHSDKTIYELIKASKHATRFAALVDDHDDMVKLLNSTKANHTLLLPSDRAFGRIPKDHPKPPSEFIQALLSYHVLPGRWPRRRLAHSHTAPTTLVLSSLHDHPQRLRLATLPLPFSPTTINFHAHLRFGDLAASNGLIHILDSILVPPPPTQKILQLLPSTFSTLSLALETTGLAEELEGLTFRGGVTFAPTNRAWTRLGPRANAFLFSERGKKYLKALVKYHLVANETVYSDAYYGRHGSDDHDSDERDGGEDAKSGRDYWHVDVPSLLDDKPISIDVHSWKGWVSIVVNGRNSVAVRDGIAKDGVVQVLGNVLLPPHKKPGGGSGTAVDGEVEVEELVERLEGLIDKQEVGDL